MTGASGALAFIGGALVTRLHAEHPERAPASIAIYFAGGGAGILLSGVMMPCPFALRGPRAWDEAWIGLGAMSLALAAPALVASTRVPRPRAGQTRPRWRKRPLLASLAAHFLFAVGSIIYMTFIIAWIRGRGASTAQVSLVWATLGVAILLSPFAWRGTLGRWRGGWPLAASMAA